MGIETEIDYDALFANDFEEDSIGIAENKLLKNSEDLFVINSTDIKVQNCKSDEAEYILANGSVSAEYLKLKGEVDERYIRLKTRLSSDF